MKSGVSFEGAFGLKRALHCRGKDEQKKGEEEQKKGEEEQYMDCISLASSFYCSHA